MAAIREGTNNGGAGAITTNGSELQAGTLDTQLKVTKLGTPSSPVTPAAPAGDHWGSAAATPPLWGASGRPQAGDLAQGEIGDCYVNTDLQQLAAQNPNFLQDHIHVVSTGSTPQNSVYGVDLYDTSGKPITAYVNGEQLLDSSSNTVGAGQNALWPAIYEKAIAVAQGEDIETLGSGGQPSEVWQTLTGQAGSTSYEGLPSVEGLTQAASSTGSGFGIGTINTLDQLPGWNGSSALIGGRYLVSSLEGDGDVAVVKDTSSNTQGWAIPLSHAMAVTGVNNNNVAGGTDESLVGVNVENPWGGTPTNQMNLQNVPYPVLHALTAESYTLPMPGSNTENNSGSGGDSLLLS